MGVDHPERSITPNLTPTSPPRWGWGGGLRATVRSPCQTPRHLASPSCGVVGAPAGQAGCQLTHPRPPNSPDSPTWASVARGKGARAVKQSCPVQQPAVIAADFTVLFDRCLASGLKARLIFSHAAGHQVLTVTCNLPAPAVNLAAAGKRRRRHRRRLRRGKPSKLRLECLRRPLLLQLHQLQLHHRQP